MARPSNTAARRLQIVEAMKSVVVEEGLARASVQRIARTAQLSPGLLHYHFSDKEEMALSLLEHLATEIELQQVRRVREDDGHWQRLDAWLAAHLEADTATAACWVALCASCDAMPRLAERLSEIRAGWLGALEGQLRVLLAFEGLGPHRARDVAHTVVALVEGARVVAVQSPAVAPPADVLRRQVRGLLTA